MTITYGRIELVALDQHVITNIICLLFATSVSRCSYTILDDMCCQAVMTSANASADNPAN